MKVPKIVSAGVAAGALFTLSGCGEKIPSSPHEYQMPDEGEDLHLQNGAYRIEVDTAGNIFQLAENQDGEPDYSSIYIIGKVPNTSDGRKQLDFTNLELTRLANASGVNFGEYDWGRFTFRDSEPVEDCAADIFPGDDILNPHYRFEEVDPEACRRIAAIALEYNILIDPQPLELDEEPTPEPIIPKPSEQPGVVI